MNDAPIMALIPISQHMPLVAGIASLPSCVTMTHTRTQSNTRHTHSHTHTYRHCHHPAHTHSHHDVLLSCPPVTGCWGVSVPHTHCVPLGDTLFEMRLTKSRHLHATPTQHAHIITHPHTGAPLHNVLQRSESIAQRLDIGSSRGGRGARAS